MQSNSGIGERTNEYALVTYVPGPLGAFLDRLRKELVSTCVARSHVTVLPPRPLVIDADAAKRELEHELIESQPFSIEIADIQCFERTKVIYLSVGEGRQELTDLHNHLNHNGLWYKEQYDYHPHITLAQEFPEDELEAKLEIARRRWAQFTGERRFEVDHLTFVQNTKAKIWQDLAQIPLNDAVLAGA